MEYEKGTIKVVWIEKDNNKIYSRMFEEEEEARKFGKTKKDYIIFSLEYQNDMKDFCWKLLPYGRYKLYLSALEIFRKGDAFKLL